MSERPVGEGAMDDSEQYGLTPSGVVAYRLSQNVLDIPEFPLLLAGDIMKDLAEAARGRALVYRGKRWEFVSVKE